MSASAPDAVASSASWTDPASVECDTPTISGTRVRFTREIHQPLALGEAVIQEFARSPEQTDSLDAAVGKEIE